MSLAVQVVTERWNPVSASIRYITRSWASHTEFCDLATGETFGARYFGGVKERSAKHSRHYTNVERFTHPRIEQAFKWALTQVGKPYDLTAIFGILADRNWREDDKWFCSVTGGRGLLCHRKSAIR